MLEKLIIAAAFTLSLSIFSSVDMSSQVRASKEVRLHNQIVMKLSDRLH
jgi:hypothetical protein